MLDKNFFLEAYTAFHLPIYKTILSMTKDAQLAQDIVHDTFLALYFYKKDTDFESMNKTKAWLIKTSVNKTINFLKKRKKVVYLSPESFERLEDNVSFIPDTSLEKKETNLEVRRAIDYLAPELKSLIVLYYFIEIFHWAL